MKVASLARLLLPVLLATFATSSLYARSSGRPAAPTGSAPKESELQITVGGKLVARLMHSTPSVYIHGTIDSGSPARFERLIASGAIPDGSFVYLNSPGGSLAAGLELGYLFRKHAMFTMIGVPPFITEAGPPREHVAICASACAYAYLGGEYREAPQPADGSPYGVHQFRYSQPDAGNSETTQKISGMIVAYLHEMGINSDVFVLSSMTAPKSVLWLSGKQMMQLGLANNGVLPLVAKYKLVKGKPYLLLEQNTSDGDHKVVLLCVRDELRLDSFYIVGKARAKEIVDRGTVSYFEINGKQTLTGERHSFQAIDNSVVLDRSVNLTFLDSVLQADTIGAYVNDQNGFLRTGFTMHIAPVRGMLANYLQNCMATLQ